MGESKFAIDQKVKFINDHDRMTGKVLDIKWSASGGFVYTVSSRYYDASINDMVDGVKICREDELVDMSSYAGPTAPVIPDKNVDLKDQVTPEPAK